MRINIKTDKPMKDKEIKALYIIQNALDLISTPKMKVATLQFFADKLGQKLEPK